MHFLESLNESVTPPQEIIQKGGTVPTSASSDLSALILSFLKEKGGKVSKSELYEWSRRVGITPVTLHDTLLRMVQKGFLIKRFDDELKDLVYCLAMKETF
ncbi:MAG: MarR family transcriptional regulator [Thermofilaceae archaeon]|nr:MarR family transcriptional regulator [Thermofilaceae archaeon]MCX8181162.1 MarR family transcriptional regulator [Thermofilaceae archaeon]MDW8004785.1 hypothetical protein [Thermofilaceae archaeon]